VEFEQRPKLVLKLPVFEEVELSVICAEGFASIDSQGLERAWFSLAKGTDVAKDIPNIHSGWVEGGGGVDVEYGKGGHGLEKW
jgi:hypothetical protein